MRFFIKRGLWAFGAILFFAAPLALGPLCAEGGAEGGAKGGESLDDNSWLSPHRLQLIVKADATQGGDEGGDEGGGATEAGPYVFQRQLSCQLAEESIDERVLTLYPAAAEYSYRKVVYKTLYLEKAECTLVVHIKGLHLKRKIQ